MPRTLDNPDRDFSATPIDEPGNLRDLLKKSEVADIFDPIVRRRLGEQIVRAVFHPAQHDNEDAGRGAIGRGSGPDSRAARSRKN